MTLNGWLQIALYFGLLLLTVKPLGRYMTDVFEGRRTFLSAVLRPVERAVYWVCGVKESEEQNWIGYGVGMLLFSVAGFASLYALMRLQAVLPFNPQKFPAVGEHLAFNTAMSFVTNTNWQSYVPETTMSYLVQMAGLTVHNFLSAATGIALAVALIRGFARRSAQTIGNFWVDLTRCTLYVLMPISIVVGLFFVWQGMPQNLGAYVDAHTLEGAKQTIAMGPVASQEVIKMLGTNGGGFFNANSAHPFENPNAITNLVQILLIFSLGAALTNVFGRMVGDQRQGWAIFAVMAVSVAGGHHGRLLGRGAGQSGLRCDACRPNRVRSANRRQHGGQGGPLRHRQFGAVHDHHDRCLLRRGQHDARQPDAARRPDPDHQHPAGRDHLRRRGLRPLRHAAVRDHRGVRRRPDGRAHAGISRQEARGARGEDVDARHPHPAVLDPGI